MHGGDEAETEADCKMHEAGGAQRKGRVEAEVAVILKVAFFSPFSSLLPSGSKTADAGTEGNVYRERRGCENCF